MKPRSSAYAYTICLAIQCVAAVAILMAILRAFRIVNDNIGVIHAVSTVEVALLAACIFTFQAAYCYRLKWIAIPEWRGVAAGHLIGFLSRLIFISGGALFSLFFLRHAPELGSTAGAEILLPRISMLLASLFCLYCYTLELERLANMLQTRDASQEGEGAK